MLKLRNSSFRWVVLVLILVHAKNDMIIRQLPRDLSRTLEMDNCLFVKKLHFLLRTAICECYHRDLQGSMRYTLFVIIADEHNGFNIEHFPQFL